MSSARTTGARLGATVDAVAAVALAAPAGASASILAGSPAVPWDTFMKDEAAVAATIGNAHAGDQAVIAATIRGQALNDALNKQHESHAQFATWINQFDSSSGQ
jgi:hypothetical protein